MKREIKFRAWDDKDKKWLLGYNYPNSGGFSMFGECMLFEEWSSILNRFHLQRKDRTPLDLKLMQFTGLLDKKGKEIYEGDIVHYDGKPFHIYALKATGQIVDYKGSWAMKYKEIYKTDDGREVFGYYNFSCEDFFGRKSEVIGNIYETPELITKN